jgi:hypothetical protein
MDMSLKEQLTSRARPSVTEHIEIKDPREAKAKLQQALRVLKQAEAKGDPVEVKRCKTAVTRAGKQLEKCFAKITLRALKSKPYEALIGEHPPTPEQIAEAGKNPADWPEWNEDTFYPALFAACAEGDMEEEDWSGFLEENVSRGERRRLYMAALAVNENERMPESTMLPKGSPGTGTWLSNLL